MALLSLSAESSHSSREFAVLNAGQHGAETRREVVLDPGGEPELWASIPPSERRARARAFNGKRIEERNGVDRS
jgi:hypothetical protein